MLLIMNGVSYFVQKQDTDLLESLWSKGVLLFSIMPKQSVLPIHSTIQTEEKWMN
jgi:hypothetical protein